MHWARDTDDVRQSFALLADALEILVEAREEEDTTVYYQQNNISK